jgi:hypothetical protein
MVGVGWVGKDEIKLVAGFDEIAEGAEDLGLAQGGGEAGFLEVEADDFCGSAVLLDEKSAVGTAAEGFKAE